jgi:glyoxylase-like metal-dependent hydrolase (beta-lactamase superfamily II)
MPVTGRTHLIALLAMVLAATPGPAVHGDEPVRTGDIRLRGLGPADFPRLTRLVDQVYAYEQIDPTKRTVTANNLIVITSEGVLVADGQGTPENVSRLVTDIAHLTPQPIRYVVIGSEHGDHTGGDRAFPGGVTFIAHPFSRTNLERQASAPRSNAPTVVVPTETVNDKRVLILGGTEIQILFLGRAHTGGDLEVFLPRERILYMSEAFSNRIFPSMANGYPSEWIATLARAEQLPADILVPAHGFIDAPSVLKEEERNYRRALELILAEGTRLHDAKVPLDAATAGANFGPFDGWTRAANNAYQAIRRVYMERDGELR